MNDGAQKRPTCGAKTRAGTPCKLPPMPNGRCRFHGGLSLSGVASPRFKHGRYSKYLPAEIAGRFEDLRRDSDLLALRDEIAIVDTRTAELMERLSTGESGEFWKLLKGAFDELIAARDRKDQESIPLLISEIGELIYKGAETEATWREINDQFERRRRLVESERKRLVEMNQVVRLEQIFILINAVVSVIAKHVDDRNTINAIALDIRRLLGSGDLSAGRVGGGRAAPTGRGATADAVGVGHHQQGHSG